MILSLVFSVCIKTFKELVFPYEELFLTKEILQCNEIEQKFEYNQVEQNKPNSMLIFLHYLCMVLSWFMNICHISHKCSKKQHLSIKMPVFLSKSVSSLTHGSIIRTGIKCMKIPLQKSIQFGMALKQNTTQYKQKIEIFLAIRPPTSRKPDSCFQFVRKDKNRIKANLQLNLQKL